MGTGHVGEDTLSDVSDPRAFTPNHVALLTRVHRRGPASRAQLTRELGLNRSTIATLVADLQEQGLAVESEPLPGAGVGRPSPLVSASPMVLAIAVDVGREAVEIGVVALDGTYRSRRRFATPTAPTPAEAVNITVSLVDGLRYALAAGVTVAGIGVSVPGLIRASDGFVRWAPNHGWSNVPLGDLLQEATGLPVVVGNDANLGARAEQLFGAAAGADDVVYINGGPTGIGSGLIIRGELLLGAEGDAGEFGHNLTGAPVHRERSLQELEIEVSFRRLLTVLDLDSATLAEVDAILRTGMDDAVRGEVRRQLLVLSVGVGNLLHILNPRTVVFGGFLATYFDLEKDFFLAALARETLEAPFQATRFVTAELGTDVVLLGAAEAAFDAFFEGLA